MTPVVATFKRAGWRPTRIVATWPEGAAEPLLLLASDRADGEALASYARRWGIERLFLAWKSRGWCLEDARVEGPERVGRRLAVYALATWWVLAAATAEAVPILDRLARRARRAPVTPPHASLATSPATGLPARKPWRPREAMESLFRIGLQAFRTTSARTATPPLQWDLPNWDAPCWSDQCLATVGASP